MRYETIVGEPRHPHLERKEALNQATELIDVLQIKISELINSGDSTGSSKIFRIVHQLKRWVIRAEKQEEPTIIKSEYRELVQLCEISKFVMTVHSIKISQ